VAVLAGVIVGIVSVVVLGYIEVRTVPELLLQVIFHGDESAGFPLGFLVIGAGMVLLPLDVIAAIWIARWTAKKLRDVL
jgi:hypothetical protein